MSKNQLAGLGAALVIAAGATTAVLWPGGPAPADVQSAPAPSPGAPPLVPAQGAVEVCDDQRDGGSGQCAVCEAVLLYDSAPDAGGTVQGIYRVIECGDPYDPGTPIPVPGPVRALGGGMLKGGGTVAQPATQARAQLSLASAAASVSGLDPNSLGCACADADPANTDCQWQQPDDPQGNTPDPVQCPLQFTMRPGTCSGANCVPKSCWETELRAYPGDSMPTACRIPPDAGAPGPDAGPDAGLPSEHP